MAIAQNPVVPATTAEEAEIRRVFRLAPSADSRCFYCGEPVGWPSVYWSGNPGDDAATGHIWLHPACIPGLTKGLMTDLADLAHLAEIRAALGERAGR